MTPRRILLTAALGLWLQALVAFLSVDARAYSGPDVLVTPAQALATFDEVWTRVRFEFYDPHLLGVDWQAVRAKYRDQAGAATTRSALEAVINRMLHELPSSHLAYYTPTDAAYYDILTILSYGSGGLTGNLARAFPDGEVSYIGIGAFTRAIDGRTFITGVLAGFPADQAGLHAGDEVLSAGGQPFSPVASFEGRDGQQTTLLLRRTRGGAEERVVVTPQRIRPAEAYGDAMRNSMRIIHTDRFSIGYVRAWTLYKKEYTNLLRSQLHKRPFADADALILDLRDGWGGGRFDDVLEAIDSHLPVAESIGRGGQKFPDANWRPAVALLVNEGTRSAKELVVYGFKKYGYGEVVGTRTAGSVLGAHGFLLDDGVFILPAFDIVVDNERLEGRGVTPTIEVPFDIRYANGRDPQLDRALQSLVGKLRHRSP